MDENRKKIIMNEISFWKESRLLPEQYCDYLLAFYSEGEDESPSIKQSRKRTFYLLYGLLISLVISALFVNYFTEIPTLMQMGLYSFFLVSAAGGLFLLNKKGGAISIPMAAAAVILLLWTVRIWELYASGNQKYLYIGMMLNCLVWYVAGKKYKQAYFVIAAFMGALAILYFAGKTIGLF